MGSISPQLFRELSTTAWESLYPLLPSRDPDSDYWWNLTGPHLAVLVEAAGYSITRQYEALIFHYHYAVPYLGPAPASDGTFAWPSRMGLEGLPIEYSWKWGNTPDQAPEIRYAMEPKGPTTGTTLDPLNQNATRDLLLRLQEAFPSLNLEWTNHFFASLFNHDEQSSTSSSATVVDQRRATPSSTSPVIAAEFKARGPSVKTYFYDSNMNLEVWKDAIEQICPPNAASRALYDFLYNSFEGRLLKPGILGLDAVKPSKSRIKFYFRTPKMTFSSARSIMTLDGHIPTTSTQFEKLRSLIIAMTGVRPDFPDDENLPLNPRYHQQTPTADTRTPLVYPACGYYFNIAPGLKYPEVKFNIPMYVYGQDDAPMARAIADWMVKDGRGDYSEQFLSIFASLAGDTGAEKPYGMQTFLSCMFTEDDGLEVTSYVAPALNNPALRPGVHHVVGVNSEHA